MLYQNIGFCVANGAMGQGDVTRLTGKLERCEKVRQLASEFCLSPREMAAAALDAGIAFMRARLGTPNAGPFFSPAPVADAGWDEMADNRDEHDFYVDFCARLCSLSGVAATTLVHHRFSDAERQMAGITGAVAAAVAAMERLGLHYVPEHWPLTATGECGDPAGSDRPPVHCKALLVG